jgi:hypothetical protein
LLFEVRAHLLLPLIVASVNHAQVQQLAKVEAPVQALVVPLKLPDRLPLCCVVLTAQAVRTVP